MDGLSKILWKIGAMALVAGVFAGCNDELKAELEKCKQDMFIVQKDKRDCQKRADELSQSVMTAQQQLKEADELKKDLEKRQALARERLDTVRQLLEQLKGNIESGDLNVRIKRGKMVLEMPSAVLFESGKADLSDKGKETLASVAQVLKGIRDREFQVAGHTDNVRVSEGNPYGDNWLLSSARAVAVVQFLSKSGVRPKQLSAAGYAEFQPSAPNKGPKGKAANRRIEITLLPNLAELPDLSDLESELGQKESAAAESK